MQDRYVTDLSRHMDRAVPTAGFGRGEDHNRSEREFARARRHSRLVAALKIGLPLLAGLIVVGGLAVTWLARSLPEDVSITGASLEDGRIVMEDPRMSGFDKSDRPYSMVARRALQSLDGGGIDLETVRATVSTGGEGTADITAAAGHYDPAGETLKLTQDIKVDTSDGLSILLDAADIDLASGRLVSPGPVRISSPNQTIEAGSLTVQDGGKLLSFGSKVRMTLLPSPKDGPAPRSPESN